MAEVKAAASDPKPATKSDIFAPGSCAQVGEHRCRVIAVTLRESVFVYQVIWWSGSERRIDNVSACELSPVAESKFWTITPA